MHAQIQFLTLFNMSEDILGLAIKVNWEEVFDYCWYDSGWNIRSAKEYNNIHIYDEHEIRSFEPLTNSRQRLNYQRRSLWRNWGGEEWLQGNIIKS